MNTNKEPRFAEVIETTEPCYETAEIGPSRHYAGMATIRCEDGTLYRFPRGSVQVDYDALVGTTGKIIWGRGIGGYEGWMFEQDRSDRFDPKLEEN